MEFGAYIGVLGRDIVDAGQGSSPTDSNPPDPPSDLLDLPGNLGAVVGEEGGALVAPEPPAPPLEADLPSRAALDWGCTRVDRAQRAGHKIVTRSTYVFCRRCARHARDRWTGLFSPCRPGAQRVIGGRLARLWSGLHPSTNQPL